MCPLPSQEFLDCELDIHKVLRLIKDEALMANESAIPIA